METQQEIEEIEGIGKSKPVIDGCGLGAGDPGS